MASFGQSEACLDPGAGIFLTPLASATLSCTLGMVWNDQTSWADDKRPSNRTLMIPAWSDQILACLDPGAGFFLIILASATLSYTLGMVWKDQTWRADTKRPSNRTLVIPAWSDGILAFLDPGAGFFLIVLASATLSCTLGMVWNDQTSRADTKRPSNMTL